MRLFPAVAVTILVAACSAAPAAPSGAVAATSPSGTAGTSPSRTASSDATASPDATAAGTSPGGVITGRVEIVDDKRADREGTYEVRDAGEGLCIVDLFSTEPVVDASLYAAEEVAGQPTRLIVDHAPVAQGDGQLSGQGGRVEITFAPPDPSAQNLYRFDSTPGLIAIGKGTIGTVRTGTSVVIRFEGQDDDGSSFRGEVTCPTVTGLQ